MPGPVMLRINQHICIGEVGIQKMGKAAPDLWDLSHGGVYRCYFQCFLTSHTSLTLENDKLSQQIDQHTLYFIPQIFVAILIVGNMVKFPIFTSYPVFISP
jgi:hypothetical protein